MSPSPGRRELGAVMAPLRARLRGTGGMLPSFLVVGTKRGGSSSLCDWVSRHPAVAPCRVRKGTHYFDVNHDRGWRWFRSMFSPQKGDLLATGEGSPYYMFHPLAPVRIAKELPQAKLIAVLRDPVERAWSHYRYERERGRENLGIAAALDAEGERLAGEEERMLADERYVSAHHRFHSYLHRGHYADQVERLQSLFPAEQLLVLQSERMFAEPDKTLADVWSFLGLSPAKIEGLPRIEQGVAADLPTDTRTRLEDYYRPLNQRLRQLPGVGFSWPRTD